MPVKTGVDGERWQTCKNNTAQQRTTPQNTARHRTTQIARKWPPAARKDSFFFVPPRSVSLFGCFLLEELPLASRPFHEWGTHLQLPAPACCRGDYDMCWTSKRGFLFFGEMRQCVDASMQRRSMDDGRWTIGGENACSIELDNGHNTIHTPQTSRRSIGGQMAK